MGVYYMEYSFKYYILGDFFLLILNFILMDDMKLLCVSVLTYLDYLTA